MRLEFDKRRCELYLLSVDSNMPFRSILRADCALRITWSKREMVGQGPLVNGQQPTQENDSYSNEFDQSGSLNINID